MSGAATEKPRSPSNSPENERTVRMDGSLRRPSKGDGAIIPHFAEQVKWIDELELALDAAREAEGATAA